MNHLTYSTLLYCRGKVYLLVGEWSHSILTCTISLFSASCLSRKMYRVAHLHMRRSGVLYKITFSEVRTNHTNLLWSVVCHAHLLKFALQSILYSMRLTKNEKLKLFHYLFYFCYYLWTHFIFLILIISFIVLF